MNSKVNRRHGLNRQYIGFNAAGEHGWRRGGAQHGIGGGGITQLILDKAAKQPLVGK